MKIKNEVKVVQFRLSNIMIVDDDPDIISQLLKIFSKLNIQNVKSFTSGEEVALALENLDEIPDCIFIDVKMRGMSGIGLIQHIKSHKEVKIRNIFCIPIIGNITREETIILQEINCGDAIKKPIIEELFLKKIDEIDKAHQDPESEKNFELAFRNALLDKKYKQAEQILLIKIKKEPSSVRYLAMYAELLMKVQQWDKAEEFLIKILRMDSCYIPALNLISKVYIKGGRFEDAMVVLEKAKNLSPLHIERLLVIGEMNLGSGHSEKAEENFRNALKINPCEEKASFGLGRALATQGKIEESKKIFSSLRKDVELISFFNNKGVLLVKAQKINDGINLYNNAMKLMNDNDTEYLLLYNMALAYLKLGNIDCALEYAKKSHIKSPPNYLKPEKLIEKLESARKPSFLLGAVEKEIEISLPVSLSTEIPLPTKKVSLPKKREEYFLTSSQMDFIVGDFIDGMKEEKSTEDEEFIS